MRNLLLSIALCFAFVAGAYAQPITTTKGQRSDAIFLNLRKIDLLNQILPVLFTKEQLNRDILPGIEKARARQKQVLSAEDDELGKLEPEIEKVMKGAIERNEMPPKSFTDSVAKKTQELSIKRQIVYTQMIEDVQVALDKSLNAGQKKALAGAFDTRFIDPTKKPEDISDQVKTRFYIERVLLDPLTRELLIDMMEHMKE